ncbi:hypothetical protein FACS1894208_00750 [Clostridia bacterium]|nr:hypothetical protein FACS1894208_00750 [Clostridia bacterium]
MCDFCEHKCTCHINPPCGFCVTHRECKVCGGPVCADRAVILGEALSGGSGLVVCPDCAAVRVGTNRVQGEEV